MSGGENQEWYVIKKKDVPLPRYLWSHREVLMWIILAILMVSAMKTC